MTLRFAGQWFFVNPPGQPAGPIITEKLSQEQKYWEFSGANDLAVVTVANRDDAFVRSQLQELGVRHRVYIPNNEQADYKFITTVPKRN